MNECVITYDDIPDDFVQLMKSLRNKFRLQLVLNLIAKGPFSLTNFSKMTNKKNSYILSHLKKLEISGVIENFLKKSEVSKEYSFYQLTKFGTYFLKNIKQKFSEIVKNFDEQINLNEFSDLINIFSNKTRILILLCLNDEQLSFSELMNVTKKSQGSLTDHLKKLERQQFIKNQFQKQESTDEYSYYSTTTLGNTLMEYFIAKYNEFYNNNSMSFIKDKNNPQNLNVKSDFEFYCGSWALPNEPILGWVRIFSDKISSLKIHLSNYLHIKEIYTDKYQKTNDKEIILEDLPGKKIKYIAFELFSEIPEANESVTNESIEATTFDLNEKTLSTKKIVVNVIKPIVKLNVINHELDKQSGFFEIRIAIIKGFKIGFKGLEIEVGDKNHKLIPIKTNLHKISDLPSKIPPEIDVDNLIGNIEIQGTGFVYFSFKIRYYDELKNEYTSNEEVITISDKNVFKNLLNCSYNFIQEGISA